jgi:flavin-dependent dehydrogenase
MNNMNPECDINKNPAIACDVLVIGGGPAGSTISSLLAEKGWKVTLLEKEHHPRFHIGESLLPMNMPILERLGVLDQVHEIGVVKYGAEFNSNEGDINTFYFKHALNKEHPHAYEVRRSEFDQLLFENSRKKGATTFEGMRVTEVKHLQENRNFVTAVDEDNNQHHWETRFVIDASGRDTFCAKEMQSLKKNRHHNNAAIFGHFSNVSRRQGEDEGNISIYWFAHGWFWMIPLKDGTMSIGAVCRPAYLKSRKVSLEEFLLDTAAMNTDVQKRMAQAKAVSPIRATANYSYKSATLYNNNCLLIGDAFTFIDPVFSSGVFIAMKSATLATDVVDAYLNNDPQFNKQLGQYEKNIRSGLRTITWFIYRFTTPGIYTLFNNPSNIFRVQEGVISMLSGDVFDNRIISKPLLFFRMFYYFASLKYLKSSVKSFFSRKENTRVRIDT